MRKKYKKCKNCKQNVKEHFNTCSHCGYIQDDRLRKWDTKQIEESYYERREKNKRRSKS